MSTNASVFVDISDRQLDIYWGTYCSIFNCEFQKLQISRLPEVYMDSIKQFKKYLCQKLNTWHSKVCP